VRVVDGFPLATLCIAGAVFAHQVAAGPHPFDAGELSVAAWSLGGSHPPGQVLHALVARAFAFLPLGPIPARMALASAAFAVVIAALAMHVARSILAAFEIRAPRVVTGAMIAAGLGTALASPVLRQALRVEVYTLALALVLVSVASLVAWTRGDGTRALWRAAFAGGLAAAVHPPHGLVAAIFGVALAHHGSWWRRPRPLAWTLAFGIAGLSVVAYLPVRALAGAAMWGDPLSVSGLWDYLSGRAYWQNTVTNPRASLVRELFDYGRHLVLVTSVAPIVGALSLPLVEDRAHARTAWRLVLATGLAVLAACLQPFQERNPDNVAWLGPATAMLAITGSAGFAVLATRAPRWLGWLGFGVVACAPATTLRLPTYLRADLPALETFAATLVDTPAPRALVVPTTDFTASSWLLARAIDGARPDVAVFCAGLAASSWHWPQLAAHPAFDGHPRRGAGATAHERYLRGLVDFALPRVSVALERELPGRWPVRPAGPYLVLGVDGDPRVEPMGERFAALVGTDAKTPDEGDAALGAAILRDHHVTRGRRLLAVERTREAFVEFVRAMRGVPPAEAYRFTGLRGRVVRPAPPATKDPSAFLLSREDAVRVAAAYAWALGRDDIAREALAAQAERGDARAFLQLAWLRLFEGNRAEAARDVDAFLAHAPERAVEAGRLRAELAR
jgi:hypothetical protein